MQDFNMIDCMVERPDWPFIPVSVAAGSARTLFVKGIPSRFGLTVTGIRIRVTNCDGEQLTKDCVRTGDVWCATFPPSHFQRYGTVKNGVVVFFVGLDETGAEQMWIQRVGDLRVTSLDESTDPGSVKQTPKAVYIKTEMIDGVQHYKQEVLVWSERQQAWGADFVGDFVFVSGGFVPFE